MATACLLAFAMALAFCAWTFFLVRSSYRESGLDLREAREEFRRDMKEGQVVVAYTCYLGTLLMRIALPGAWGVSTGVLWAAFGAFCGGIPMGDVRRMLCDLYEFLSGREMASCLRRAA